MLVCVAPTTHALRAQGYDRLSVEAGGFYQRFTGNLESQTGPGVGYDAQLRYAKLAWSIGAGVDYVRHERSFATFVGSPPTIVIRSADADFVGAFVEPRIVLGDQARRVRPYLMLRVGLGRAKPAFDLGSGDDDVEAPVNSFTWNGGLGLLLTLAGPLSMDVGVGGGMIKWKAHDDRVFDGQTIGNGSTSTGNFMARLGLSLGVMR